MANTTSAKKMVRKIEARAIVNKRNRTLMRSQIKKVMKAIESGNKQTALESFKEAQPHIHRSVSKGILHKNTAARKISRLSAQIKKMAGEFIVR